MILVGRSVSPAVATNLQAPKKTSPDDISEVNGEYRVFLIYRLQDPRMTMLGARNRYAELRTD